MKSVKQVILWVCNKDYEKEARFHKELLVKVFHAKDAREYVFSTKSSEYKKIISGGIQTWNNMHKI